MKIGITGQGGFIGTHLYNTLGLFPEEFERIVFRKEYFEDEMALDTFVGQCDVIVHLAAMNRHESEEVIYRTNIDLVEKLVASLNRMGSQAHVLISSSTQEERDNLYGRSKREGRDALARWAEEKQAKFTGLLIPNVFGAFGKPFYNSFIATFCHQLTHGQQPSIAHDGEVKLIYVQELVDTIINLIRNKTQQIRYEVAPTATKKVSEVLALLQRFSIEYLNGGKIPDIKTRFELNLFNTFCTYINHGNLYPRRFQLNSDSRGTFVETLRGEIGGQSSYSFTNVGATRGNHYHTRKIERFSVIRGKALIQLRKIGTDRVLNFYLDGGEPAYVDMPIWYTHNIKNVGNDELITIFWINEPYNPDSADTYFEKV